MKIQLKHIYSNLVPLCLLLGMAHQANAEGGYYIGGSVGSAGIELDAEDFEFDESDTAVKIFGGYNFDVTVLNLAIEGGYVDFGNPSNSVDGGIDLKAWDVFGVAGLELGPIGFFGKIGVFNWDADVDGGGDSGTDPAYGVGAKFSLGSIEVRAEYELFDIGVDDVDSADLTMISVGAAWTF